MKKAPSKTTKTGKKTAKAPRQVERTEARKKLLLEALRASRGILSTAIASAGIARQTYYNWLEADPEFASQAGEILELQLDFVESNLLERIEAGDTTATIFYLKTKGRSRGYSERTELTGKDGRDLVKDIRIEVVDVNHSDN